MSFDHPNIYFWESTRMTPLWPCKGNQCFAALLLLQFYLLWHLKGFPVPCPHFNKAKSNMQCLYVPAFANTRTVQCDSDWARQNKNISRQACLVTKSFIYMLRQHTMIWKRWKIKTCTDAFLQENMKNSTACNSRWAIPPITGSEGTQ